MKKPVISVVIPTYNRSRDLELAIKSFLIQKYEDTELVIHDNCSSDNTFQIVKKWQEVDSRIIYYRNDINIGFVDNLRKSIIKAKGDYIVLLGDDDRFIHPRALNYFIQAFGYLNVGVVKAGQILIRDEKLNQAYPLDKKNKDIITVFNKGKESLEKLWFESLSIAGLAFKKTRLFEKFENSEVTLYPQVELAGRMCLNYDCAMINRHLIAVKSQKDQMNCLIYDLAGKKTDIISDWQNIYRRIKKYAVRKKMAFITDNKFQTMLSRYLIIFLPYSVLTVGRTATGKLVMKLIKLNPRIIFSPFFDLTLMLIFLIPDIVLKNIVELIKKIRIRMLFSSLEIVNLNKMLKT